MEDAAPPLLRSVPPTLWRTPLHPCFSLKMKEAFDPSVPVAAATPEADNGASIFTRKNIWSDAAAKGDDDSSPWPWDGVKSEEDADFLSHANRALSFLSKEQQQFQIL
ncbi:hypothetical protein ACQJBY_054628 [Aegilops geniculata]